MMRHQLYANLDAAPAETPATGTGGQQRQVPLIWYTSSEASDDAVDTEDSIVDDGSTAQ